MKLQRSKLPVDQRCQHVLSNRISWPILLRRPLRELQLTRQQLSLQQPSGSSRMSSFAGAGVFWWWVQPGELWGSIW